MNFIPYFSHFTPIGTNIQPGFEIYITISIKLPHQWHTILNNSQKNKVRAESFTILPSFDMTTSVRFPTTITVFRPPHVLIAWSHHRHPLRSRLPQIADSPFTLGNSDITSKYLENLQIFEPLSVSFHMTLDFRSPNRSLTVSKYLSCTESLKILPLGFAKQLRTTIYLLPISRPFYEVS